MNKLEQDEIARIIQALKGSHEVDIVVRKDGVNHHFEADWLRGVLDYFTKTTGVGEELEQESKS